MELTKIAIKNFKRIENVELSLTHLNILVGSNGSGKSSILQAIHLASCVIRQARELRKTNTSTIGVSDLDYLPSNNYPELGYRKKWGNQKDSPSSRVEYSFLNSFEEAEEAYTEMRSARNAGISVKGDAIGESRTILRDKNKFFSAYIPGISGIPNEEQKLSKRVVLKACSFGDANFY